MRTLLTLFLAAAAAAACGPSRPTLAPAPHLRAQRQSGKLERTLDDLQTLERLCETVGAAPTAPGVVEPPPARLRTARGRRVWAQMQVTPWDRRSFARASTVHFGPSFVCEALPGAAPCNYDCADPVEQKETYGHPPVQGKLRHARLHGDRTVAYIIGHTLYTEDLETGVRRMRRREFNRSLQTFRSYGPFLYVTTLTSDEVRRIARIDPSGAYHPLTAGAPVEAHVLGASPEHLYFTADWRERGVMDVFRVPHDDEYPTAVIRNSGAWSFDAVSDDGARLIGRLRDHPTLLVWNLEAPSAKPRALPTPEGLGPVHGFESATHRVWLHARREGRRGVYSMDVDAAATSLRPAPWGPTKDHHTLISVGRAANLAVVHVRRGTESGWKLLALDSPAQTALPELPGRPLEMRFTPDGRDLLLLAQDKTTRRVLRWTPPEGPMQTLTSSAWTPVPEADDPGQPRLGEALSVERAVLSLERTPGSTVDAVAFRPHTASSGPPAPAILRIFDRPVDKGIAALEHRWVTSGMAVVAVHLSPDDDVTRLAEQVRALPWVRDGPLAIVGEGALAPLAHRALTGGGFAGGITLFGQPTPTRGLGRLQSPLLIVYGTADVRVPRETSERHLDALLADGQPVANIALLGAGHDAIYAKQGRRLRATTTAYLRGLLFGEPAPGNRPR